MNLSVSFENLEEVKKAFDPEVVEKATYSTINQLTSKAATQVRKGVLKEYNVRAAAVNAALKKRVRRRQGADGVPTGFLIYLSGRISLRNFSYVAADGFPKDRARPKVRTPRGVRRGARVRVMKSRPPRVVKGAFWGRGRVGKADAAGQYQIFQRIGLSRLKVRKLSGPGVAQMVRGEAPIEELNTLMREEANVKFAQNLDHFMLKQAGLR